MSQPMMLNMSRIFKCDAKTVYNAIADGVLFKETGPLPGKMEMDFSEGGKYRMEWDDCGAVEGEFLQLIPGEKVVFSWDKVPPADTLYKTTVTIDLSENDGATTLTLKHEGFTTTEQCEDHNAGWDTTLRDMMKSMRELFFKLEKNKTGLDLHFKHRMTVNAPVAKVFNAVQDGQQLAKYFPVNREDSFVEGETVRWNFDNYPEFSLFVHKVIENQCIKFKWENTHVAFSFRPKGESITEVTIETTGYEVSQAGLDSSYSESEGWTDFMWRLRLYLENNWTYETLQKSVQP